MSGHVVALSGGVGGAKLAHGLYLALGADELTIIANTGDDFRHLGLKICPDIDSIVYALAELSDPVRGWGRREETWIFMQALRQLGGEDWFALGDADLAMHVERSRRLAQGETLCDATRAFCRALGIRADILPMTEDAVSTRLRTDEGWLDFQEYFVRRRCEPVVRECAFDGAAAAHLQPSALAALGRRDLRAVILCPSNPFLSIDPILAVPGMRDTLAACAAPVIAVTPLIGGRALKGPAAKIMRELGFPACAGTVARRYADFIDCFIFDETDAAPPAVAGIAMAAAPTVMTCKEDRLRLAQELLALAPEGG
jgi:LPPG:FO 2-phospho-L-lactate transferase